MTWHLGTVAGIAVRMHATFVLLLVFVGWQHWLAGRSLAAVVAGVSFILAFLFAFLGLTGSPLLLFIALFVWIGASQESSMTQMRSALAGIPVSQATITEYRFVAPTDPLERVVELLLAGVQQDFPVVVDGRLVGIVLGADLPRALQQRGTGVSIESVMRRDVPTVDSHDMLESAFRRLHAAGSHVGAVEHDGRLVGLVTLDNVGEFLMVQASLAAHVRRGLPPNSVPARG